MSTHSNAPLILGWGHTRFGKLQEENLESLVVEAGTAALRDAGVEPGEIDLVVFGNFNSGMYPMTFPSSLALQIDDALRDVEAIRVENACASGSTAVQTALRALLAGSASRVLVIGAEKMTAAPANVVGTALLGADYEAAGGEASNGFASLFAEVADEYERRYGPISDELGSIASKSHNLGALNPLAHLRKPLTVEECRQVSDANPLVAGILRRTDCSPVSDGAAAVVIGTSPGKSDHAPVRIAGWGAASDFLPRDKRDPLEFRGSEVAWNRALASAGITLDDIDFIELHDCFTIAELNLYEVLGIAPRGEGRRAINEGWVLPTGKLPVNPSGGLKSKGHPVGATGVSQHVLASMQLNGTFPGQQLESPRIAALHNMGGLAVANYVSVLAATE